MKYSYGLFICLLVLCLVTTIACNKGNQDVSEDRPDDKSPRNSLDFTDNSAIVFDEAGTLEERYKAAKEGAIITLKPGKYNLDQTLVIDRDVTIRGEVLGKVIINSSAYSTFVIPFGSPKFENLTIVSTSEEKESRVFSITGGTPKLQRCVITTHHGSGVHVSQKETAPEITDCTIKECGNNGIVVEKYAYGKFLNCNIYGNQSDGIVVKNNANPVFTNCKIHEGKGAGIEVSQRGCGVFTECDIYGHTKMEIIIPSYATPLFQKCKIHDGVFGIGVLQMSLGTFEECDIYGHLLAGVAAYLGGMPILKKCKIRDGMGVGVLIGNAGLGNFSHCDIFGNVNGVYILDSGNPFLGKCQIHDQKKCGILAEKQANARIVDCDIYRNTEAGIHITDSSKLHVFACKIHDEKNVGIFIGKQGQGRFEGNTLENNPTDWDIRDDAGEITGSGNTPELPKRE